MKVRSCDLRYQITIEEPTEDQDTTGQTVQTWSTFATTRASIDTTTGLPRAEEVALGGSLEPKIVVTFTMRYVSGLTEKMRISFRNDYYNIIGIADVDARQAFHVVRTIRGLNNG